MRRKRLRLAEYDYTTPGAYFVTILVYQRRGLLASVREGRSVLTEAGRMVLASWQSIPARHTGVAVDAFVVMPDHVHGILWLRPAEPGSPTESLIEVLQAFKSLTTCAYMDGVRRVGWSPFERHLWHRSYHERIIRDDAHLNACRDYIASNPLRSNRGGTFTDGGR